MMPARTDDRAGGGMEGAATLADTHRHKHERLKRNLDERTYRLAKRMGKAINDHRMIKEGDRVLVAVSGGKDSITLLHLLALRLMWLPIRYDLVAVHVRGTARTPVFDHRVVRVTLATGRVIEMSPGHPTADGRFFGDLRGGEALDGIAITDVELVPFGFAYTVDLLPDSDTATYVAGGALVGSTLAN